VLPNSGTPYTKRRFDILNSASNVLPWFT